MHRPHGCALRSALDVPNVAQAVAGGHRKIHLGQAFPFAAAKEHLTKCLLQGRYAIFAALCHKPIVSDWRNYGRHYSALDSAKITLFGVHDRPRLMTRISEDVQRRLGRRVG